MNGTNERSGELDGPSEDFLIQLEETLVKLEKVSVQGKVIALIEAGKNEKGLIGSRTLLRRRKRRFSAWKRESGRSGVARRLPSI